VAEAAVADVDVSEADRAEGTKASDPDARTTDGEPARSIFDIGDVEAEGSAADERPTIDFEDD
jgi:hypothetical protein